jgi:hypothetical protein
MSAPKMHPNGFVSVTSTAKMHGRIEVFGYGFHEDAVNPGDLVIITTDYLMENAHRQKIEFSLKLRGRDMYLFEDASHTARLLWDENKHWLNAAPGTPNLDMRGKSEIRLGDQLEALNRFLES